MIFAMTQLAHYSFDTILLGVMACNLLLLTVLTFVPQVHNEITKRVL